MRAGTTAAVITAAVALSASAAAHVATAPLTELEVAGISLGYPSRWFVTTQPLSNGVNPTYRFAVSTVPIKRTPKDLGPCLAGIAKQVPEDRVLVYLREALGADRRSSLPRMQPRPQRFRLPAPADRSLPCFGDGGRWVPFRSGGRAFYLGLYVGPKAPPRSVEALRQIIEGMHIDARR